LIQEKYGVFYKNKRPFDLLFKKVKLRFHKACQVYEKSDEIKLKDWKIAIKPKLEEAFEDPEKLVLYESEVSNRRKIKVFIAF
jgi:hypothetical protein